MEICKGIQENTNQCMLVMKIPKAGEQICKRIKRNVLRAHTVLGILLIIKFLYLYLWIFLTGNMRFLDQRKMFNYSENICCQSLMLQFPIGQCSEGRNLLCVHRTYIREPIHLLPPLLQREGERLLPFNINKCSLGGKVWRSLSQLYK